MISIVANCTFPTWFLIATCNINGLNNGMSTSGVKVKLYTDAMLVYYTPGHQAHTDLAKPPLGRQVATMQS